MPKVANGERCLLPKKWKIDPEHPALELIEGAADVIRREGVVVYPTETYYGLGGVPGVERVVERIYQIKGRDFHKPLPLIADELASARAAAMEWPEAAQRLAEAFWPGPLTLIVPAARGIPAKLHARTGTVAIRVSSHPVARMLARAVGGLLISTSANRSGEAPCSDLHRIDPGLVCETDGMVDSGVLPGGMPSTLVDLVAQPPRLAREGCIPWHEIRPLLIGSH